MHRIDNATAVLNLHGTGKHGFGGGDPVNGIPATRFTPDWCNDLQENIARAIEAAGISLSKGNGNQLTEAIQTLIAASSPNLSAYLRRATSDVLAAGYWTTPVAVAATGGVITPNLTAGNVFTHTLTAATTLAFPATVPGAGMALLVLRQDATGGRVLTLGSGYRVAAGSFSKAPGAVNLLWLTLAGDGVVDVVMAQRGA